MDVDKTMLYLDFVVERHRVWERRQKEYSDDPGLRWSDDPILNENKFTNVFRILDTGSQFVLNELLTPDVPFRDRLARAFVYRYTNRPEPWIAWAAENGQQPTWKDMNDGTFTRFLTAYRDGGRPVFGSAYKMFVGAENKGLDRITWAVGLSRFLTRDFADDFLKQDSLGGRVVQLSTLPRCAGFMAMQIVTDMGLDREVRGDENESVVAGPGSRAGAALLNPEQPAEFTIRWAKSVFDGSGPRLVLPDGTERAPSLMDLQNTFCEFSKYMRYYEQSKPGRGYRVGHPGPQARPFFPAHWLGQ